MKFKFFILIFSLSILFSCASKTSNNFSDGKVVNFSSDKTFQAEYKGQILKIGDRVSILKYKDLKSKFKTHQSKILPIKQKKIIIGEGVVSSVLKNSFYEFKSESPQYIPEGAFIEKL